MKHYYNKWSLGCESDFPDLIPFSGRLMSSSSDIGLHLNYSDGNMFPTEISPLRDSCVNNKSSKLQKL